MDGGMGGGVFLDGVWLLEEEEEEGGGMRTIEGRNHNRLKKGEP